MIAGLSPAQMLDIAAQAETVGESDAALAIYSALARDPDVEVRAEARFRHAMLLQRLERHADAAVLLRSILDEQPDAHRVRLELAGILTRLGDLAAARHELRAAQAGPLPAEVALLVDQFSNALRAFKPAGGSIDIAIAPDSNINRATRSDKLETVLGQFDLSEDASAQAGIGLSVKGQAYLRAPLDRDISLLGRLSASADLYSAGQFNDIALSYQLGPEIRSGADRISPAAGLTYRWYGGKIYSRTVSATVGLQHPIDRRTQLSLTGSLGSIDNRFNDAQDGEFYAASASVERALTQTHGLGAALSAQRQDLRDRGYALTSASGAVFGWAELGGTSLVATLSYQRLEADARLLLFPRRRVDDRYGIELAGIFRQLTIWRFAPVVRLRFERNASTVGLYDYRRAAVEFGIARAF